MQNQFTVKTSVFEGPFEVLLNLIEKRKLFINDIALAQVADDYISYVKSVQDTHGFPTSEVAQFILVASTLLLIKSKSLLPNLSLTEEEFESMNDLETRLKIYQRLRDASLNISNLFGKKVSLSPNPRKDEIRVFAPDKKTNLENIFLALKNVIKSLPKKEFLPKVVVQKVISLPEMIDRLTERITSGIRMSFKNFAGNKADKVNIIVSFLAMLELVKDGIINVRQEKDFDDIEMETGKVGIPTYN